MKTAQTRLPEKAPSETRNKSSAALFCAFYSAYRELDITQGRIQGAWNLFRRSGEEAVSFRLARILKYLSAGPGVGSSRDCLAA
jgi:hypothetical protein